jgi:hypothetical protein
MTDFIDLINETKLIFWFRSVGIYQRLREIAHFYRLTLLWLLNLRRMNIHHLWYILLVVSQLIKYLVQENCPNYLGPSLVYNHIIFLFYHKTLLCTWSKVHLLQSFSSNRKSTRFCCYLIGIVTTSKASLCPYTLKAMGFLFTSRLRP